MKKKIHKISFLVSLTLLVLTYYVSAAEGTGSAQGDDPTKKEKEAAREQSKIDSKESKAKHKHAKALSKMEGLEGFDIEQYKQHEDLRFYGKRIAKIDALIAEGDAKSIVESVLADLEIAESAEGTEIVIWREGSFEKKSLVGCPDDPVEREKYDECFDDGKRVRSIGWTHKIDDIQIDTSGGQLEIDEDGTVLNFRSTIFDLTEAPTWTISREEAEFRAIEQVRMEFNAPNIEANTAYKGKKLGRHYSIDDDLQLISYWEIAVQIVAPERLRGAMIHVRIDGVTGEATVMDYNEYTDVCTNVSQI